VKELTAAGVPVAMTWRVLKLARQPYYRWLDKSVADAAVEQAYRANALFDAHREDPEFGYRFLADEVRRFPPLLGVENREGVPSRYH
jgi:putative transposase